MINKEDYEEPRCVFCKPQDKETIPLRRIIEKLDEYLADNDYEAGVHHLKYWLNEAEFDGDEHGKLSVLNEQIGIYRKMLKEEECLKAAEQALECAQGLSIDGTITLATTYVNVATGFKAFGRAKEALPYYKKAQEIYEASLKENDSKLGALYNNMALCLVDLDMQEEAIKMYDKALGVMAKVPGVELEMAITYCNLADLKGLSEKEIDGYLEKAYELFNTPTLKRDSYYAFVADKCAPVFGYYGYFLYEQALRKRADS